MRIKDGFVLRQVADSYVVMSLGGELSFNGMIALNETGALIWRSLDEGLDVDAIADRLVSEYETDHDTAKRDVASFIEKIRQAGILE